MKLRIAALALTTAVAGVAAAPAAFADTADTTVSVTLLGGGLTIGAPTTASLGSVSAAVGTVASASLGTTTVSDSRGSLLGWSVTAVTTTAGMATADATPKTIALTPAGPLSWVTGTVAASGASLLSGVTAGGGGFLNDTTPIPVAAAVLSAGGGTYTYNPTVSLTVPANTAAGTYSVVVTQTVS